MTFNAPPDPLLLQFLCSGGLLPSLSPSSLFSPLLSCMLGLALMKNFLSSAGTEHSSRRGICSHSGVEPAGSLGSLHRQERSLWSFPLKQELGEFRSTQASWTRPPRPSSKPPLGGSSQTWGISKAAKPMQLSMGLLPASTSLKCTSDKMSKTGKSSL